MRTFLVTLAMACSAGLAAAQRDSAFESAACRNALAALDAAEAGAPARDAAALARIDARRRAAAVACLGADADHAPEPQRLAQPPVSVYPPAPGGAPLLPLAKIPPPAVALPRVPAVQPPVALTSCDAAGCWASDGTRLNRLGQSLVAPGGSTCSVVGAVVHCP